ncbi:MAG: DNA repair exonuclease [Phycisphaerae bacterium]|jgi:DNA repair exonuclease SbcCD nuclease subunit|nr:DNA repair exonuclease [Phycisphaerae bacterium]
MSIRILCTGDVHLGRRPSRVPEGIDAHALGPTAAWNCFVRSAIELKVHAACLTGDVVDRSNRFYEAFSVLQSGVRQLVDAGITIYAVSGNHDWDVLPRLADQIPEFHLLGRGGRWEESILPSKDTPAVRFMGWSFPSRHFSANPLAQFVPPTGGMVTVGLLHCDCGVADSSYGPVVLDDMTVGSVDAWLLGHIHKPSVLSKSSPLVLYPGSPQGLNPGERGSHGASLVTIEPGQPPKTEHLPLAALRWEQIDVPLEGVGDEEALAGTVIEAMRAKHDEIRGEIGYTRSVGCRLHLQGRTAIHRRLPSLIPGIQADLKPPFDEVEYFIEKIEDLSRPDLSLEDLAGSNDPAGLLAGRLLLLDRKTPEEPYLELIAAARRAIQEQRSGSVFASLPDSTDRSDDEEVRGMLVKAGLTMLDHLLAQKEVGA